VSESERTYKMSCSDVRGSLKIFNSGSRLTWFHLRAEIDEPSIPQRILMAFKVQSALLTSADTVKTSRCSSHLFANFGSRNEERG
jgi:hypothetical protein